MYCLWARPDGGADKCRSRSSGVCGITEEIGTGLLLGKPDLSTTSDVCCNATLTLGQGNESRLTKSRSVEPNSFFKLRSDEARLGLRAVSFGFSAPGVCVTVIDSGQSEENHGGLLLQCRR